MKRIWTIITATILLSLILAACGGTATPAPTAAPVATAAPAAAKLKIAMLVSGPVNDEGWGQTAYEGLMSLKSEGYEVAYTENVQQADQASMIDNYINQGFNVIVGHGFEYGDALTAAAAKNPKLYFIQIGGIATADNLASYLFKTGEGGYIAGMLAAQLSKASKWGFVGAMEIPSIQADQLAYEQAVKEAHPDASIVSAYTGSWTDIPKAKEAALAQISAGVDFILANGDNANVGVIQAVAESGKDVTVIGWTRDQSKLAPNNVATSIIQHVDVLLKTAIANIESGQFKGGNYIGGVAEGLLNVGIYGPMVTAEMKASIDKTMEDLKANKISLPQVK